MQQNDSACQRLGGMIGSGLTGVYVLMANEAWYRVRVAPRRAGTATTRLIVHGGVIES